MTGRDPTVIAKTVVRVVVPLMLVTALALLIQGHNRPGGGFIAGVMTATAVALTYIIYGLDYIRTELLNLPVPASESDEMAALLSRDLGVVFGLGLLLAAGSGAVAMGLGFPFLTQAVLFLKGLPVYHELEVASALAFDLGVYAVVVGALVTILGMVGAE